MLQSHWNFPNGLFNYIQAWTVHWQDFGTKFNLTNHNGAPVADIFKSDLNQTVGQILYERSTLIYKNYTKHRMIM